MKKLWLFLPIATMFLCFYMVFEVIPFGPRAFMFWWDVPASICMVIFWLASAIFAASKAE